MQWDKEAQARINKVPFFVRKMAKILRSHFPTSSFSTGRFSIPAFLFKSMQAFRKMYDYLHERITDRRV